MSSTASLQKKPDFYTSKEECLESSRVRIQTNPRYANFNQTNFTAGDEEQFQQYRDSTNGSELCIPHIPLENNLFADRVFEEWYKYKDVPATAVTDTFRYIFDKFKKGIFVKIKNNKLAVFLPFSKYNFKNEWGHLIKVDPSRFPSLLKYLEHISRIQGYDFNERRVNANTYEWYANNCLVRYEYPMSEGDTNVSSVKNMLEELCASRKLPDMEFFINRRDFPIIKKDGTEPYNGVWKSSNLPLVSHNYDKYIPILSPSVTDRYADVLSVTLDDWVRVQSKEGKYFGKDCGDMNDQFPTPWELKKPIAVFRGGSTGCGVTIETNMRLKVSYISHITPPDENGVPYLDAGITKWNLRPRSLENNPFLQTIETNTLPFGLVSRLSPEEQSTYKYIVHIDGHVSAFRLGLEMNMGSVVLLVDSEWTIWFRSMLMPFVHYVPVKADLSDLLNKIKWCRDNDDKCKIIAQNAKKFYEKYLGKKGVLDYMQKILIDIKTEMGTYLYNYKSPIEVQLQEEKRDVLSMHSNYPSSISRRIVNYSPSGMKKCFGLLQGKQWVINMLIDNNLMESSTEFSGTVALTKMTKVSRMILGKRAVEGDGNKTTYFIIKKSDDQGKKSEHIHEAFVGTRVINNLTKYIPNFVYTYGLYRVGDTYNMLSDYVNGQTLFKYISSDNFDFQTLLMILIQTCLALEVAQNNCAFVHNNLTPLNIMLYTLPSPATFDYIIGDNIIRVSSSIVPIIIDYGKAHVIYKQRHYGIVNMFKTSTVQDIFTILITSVSQILEKRLSRDEFSILIRICNFLSGSMYRREPFKTAADLKEFLRYHRRYSVIVESKKYDLEEKTPINLVNYILNVCKGVYSFQIGTTKVYRNALDDGNARQVFDYFLSANDKERINSYLSIFANFNTCSLITTTNIFMVYYMAQCFYKNLESTNKELIQFVTKLATKAKEGGGGDIKTLVNKDVVTLYKEQYAKCMEYLHTWFEKAISNNLSSDSEEEDKEPDDSDIVYTINGDYSSLKQAQYTEETFLLPERILDITKIYDNNDLSDYKNIVQLVLLNKDKYELPDRYRTLYLENFKRLLRIKSINMKNNNANIKTLVYLSKVIYSDNLTKISQILSPVDRCSEIDRYVDVYNSIIKRIGISALDE